jgi:hypothetical protein
MLQFYFLSVFLNALAGYLLFFGDNGPLGLKSDLSITEDKFRLIVGILSAFTGLFKILSPIEGDVPVVGDLASAVTGLLCGFILIFEYYRRSSSPEDSEKSEKLNRFFTGNKKIIGAAAIIAAVLHFLLPKVLLL